MFQRQKTLFLVKGLVGKEELTNKAYEQELRRLQVELVRIQEWVTKSNEKIVVFFDGGRAGNGGVNKRIAERVSPRVYRIVAMPVPTERQKSQFYFERYVEQLTEEAAKGSSGPTDVPAHRRGTLLIPAVHGPAAVTRHPA